MFNGNLLNAIGALFFGAVIGFIGVVLHNAFQPIGILLALLTTAIGISFAGQLFGSRKYKLIAAIAWLAVALRAGTYGIYRCDKEALNPIPFLPTRRIFN